MTPYPKRCCQLTKRLAEKMKIRHAAQATIDAYTFHARRLADFTKKSLDRVTPEDVRSFQLDLIDTRKVAYSSFTTTMVYLHCRGEHLTSVPSPLDWLPVRQLPTYQPAEENGSASDKMKQNNDKA